MATTKPVLNPEDVRRSTIATTAQLRLINDQFQLLTAEEMEEEAAKDERD